MFENGEIVTIHGFADRLFEAISEWQRTFHHGKIDFVDDEMSMLVLSKSFRNRAGANRPGDDCYAPTEVERRQCAVRS